MRNSAPVSVCRRHLLFLCCFLLATSLSSPLSAEIMQRIQAGIEGVAKGMDYVGEQAGQLLGPGIPLQGDAEAAFEQKRVFEEQYPVGQSPMIALSNEFGAVRVSAWNENIVRITAEISAGAATQEIAEQLAQVIEIKVEHGEDYLECRTVYPEVKSTGQMSLSVNYTIQIPQSAGLAVDNFFGDVFLSDIGGMVVANVQYGGLEINEAHGKFNARVQGDFPVRIHNLRQGGVFKLQGVSAEFTNIHGEVDINQFRGKIKLQQLGADAHVTLNCDSAQALLALAPNASPDLSAVVVYGKLESELDLARSQRGTQLIARYPNAGAQQKIIINAAFCEVALVIEGNTAETGDATMITSKVFTDTRQETIPFSGGDAVHITAIPGNLQIEGADTDHIFVEATRIVWTPSAAAALDALDALELQTSQEGNVISIQTRLTQDMALFDCESHRVDLRLVYPRELPLHIDAEEGTTSVTGIGLGVTVNQKKGMVALEHIKSEITVTNGAGDIKVQDCSGPVKADTRFGSISIEKVYGNIHTTAEEGSTYLDAPHGDVYMRHKSGDVRVLCLDPIQGNFDILVEDGNLNAFIAPDSDAALNVKAVNGRVQSSLSLSGTINRDFQEFFGRLNAETHTIRLECLNGDIFLN